MTWTEVSPGRWKRPFDTLEKFYRAIAAGGIQSGREHWTISIAVRFRLDSFTGDIEEALRHAWKTMRFDHPQIAAVADRDMYVYEVPTAATLNSWLADTFIVAPSTTTVEDLYATFKPSSLASLHYLPHTSQILLHSSHWRLDGLGAMHLLNQLFEAVIKPRSIIQFGSEPENLSPSLDEATGVSASRTTPDVEDTATKLLIEFVGNLPSIGVPMRANIVDGPGATRRSEIDFDPKLTSELLSVCKSRGFSITTATHAAIVNVTQQLEDERERTGPTNQTEKTNDRKLSDDSTASATSATPAPSKYTSLMIFDFRRHLPAPYNNTAAHPISVYHTGLPISVTSPSSFSTTAAHLNESYKRSFGAADAFAVVAAYVRKLEAVVTSAPPPGTPPPTQPALSSLGIVDHILRNEYVNDDASAATAVASTAAASSRVSITGFWLGVEMLTPGLMMHVWTQAGRLKVSACYNESLHEVEMVEGFLGRVKAAMLMELGVPVLDLQGVNGGNTAVMNGDL